MEPIEGLSNYTGQWLVTFTRIHAAILVDKVHDAAMNRLERGCLAQVQAHVLTIRLQRVLPHSVEGEQDGAVAAKELINRVLVAMYLL